MTSRRGRSSGSGQPGTQVWRESIQGIKRELEASNRRLVKVLEEQDAERAEEVQRLYDLAESLRVEELLSHMNDTLLDGQGVIQAVLLWSEQQILEGDDYWDDDEEEDDEDDEDEDEVFELSAELTVVLSWKAAGRLQISVEFQDDKEDGMEMRVNGWITAPPTSRNLQNGLIRAFREQMDENYGKPDEEYDN